RRADLFECFAFGCVPPLAAYEQPYLPCRDRGFHQRLHLPSICSRRRFRRLVRSVTPARPDRPVPSVSAEPMPSAKAPAFMKSDAFEKSIPPVGIGRRCGNGPNRSRRYPGPRRAEGKILIVFTPASRISPTSICV